MALPLPSSYGFHYKSLWLPLGKFIWHWYEPHGNEVHKLWDAVAIGLNLTCNDLGFSLLGVNLDDCPLSAVPEGMKALPKILLHCEGRHDLAGPVRSLPSFTADAPGNAGTATAKSAPAAKARSSSAAHLAPVSELDNFTRSSESA